MFKRGISPLIATVLIIGFTVSIASVIMVWGGDFIKGIQGRTEAAGSELSGCAEATIRVSGAEHTAPGKFNFLVENTGKPDIKSVIVRLNGDKGSVSVTKPGLKSAAKKVLRTEFDSAETGLIANTEVIPTIDVKDKPTSCVPGEVLEANVDSSIVNSWVQPANGAVDIWEECDPMGPTFPLGLDGAQLACEDVGYSSGSLGCTVDGLIDVSGCVGTTTCGNQQLDAEEECDNDADGFPLIPTGIDCTSFGFAGGQLYCAEGCVIDISYCETSAGDAVWQDVENWDDTTVYPEGTNRPPITQEGPGGNVTEGNREPIGQEGPGGNVTDGNRPPI